MTLFITSPCFSERSLCHPWLLYQPSLTFLRKEDSLYISIYAKGGENSPAVISFVLRMGRVLEKVLSISWMGNSSGDPPDPFFFWFCFQLASFLLALVDIYRNFPSSNYPWRMGNPKAAFSHQNLFPLLNSWRVRCDQAYQMRHSGGMVKKDLQTFRGYSLWVHWRSHRIQQPVSRATEPGMWQRVFCECHQNPWWHSEQSGLLGCIHVCHHFMRLNLQLSWGFCELPPSSPHPQRSCQ